MEGTPGKRGANFTFTFDPMNKVIGVIDNPNDTEEALRDLIAVGFPGKEIALLTDEDEARRIRASNEWPEVSVHIFHSTQKLPAFYDAPVIVRRLEQELHAGHHLVGVIAKDSETRQRASGILKSHSGHFINFYGRWAAEALEP